MTFDRLFALPALTAFFGNQVHAAPFYIMDEVDASLDAHHAERAGRYMAKRAREANVQYLVISHRPELYLHADRLIGTYGIHDGSSQCVAVSFPRPGLPE